MHLLSSRNEDPGGGGDSTQLTIQVYINMSSLRCRFGLEKGINICLSSLGKSKVFVKNLQAIKVVF